MRQLIEQNIESLASDFIQVRNATLELFRPLKIEDAVMQSDVFGSPPNWHLAHVTWFFHKVLEKHGEKLDDRQDGINLAYLNSYYQQYGQILSKSERGKYPRPTVEQTLKYRSIIDKAGSHFLTRD
ncbi:MAG: DinB family protein [Thermoproteota archaeon]|nr:DinB family protein [Thermoproteota archaeon]